MTLYGFRLRLPLRALDVDIILSLGTQGCPDARSSDIPTHSQRGDAS